jgi:transcriptional regulator with XRE-family HTH domain
LRYEQEWSVRQLSEKCGVPASTIRGWIYKDIYPKIAPLEKACAALGWSLEEFFQEDFEETLSRKQLLILLAKLTPEQLKIVKAKMNEYLLKRR